MTIESVTYIDDLDNNYPEADDPKSEGDDHIRNIKTAIKSTFPNVTGAVTPTHTELNYVDGVTSSIQTQINTAMANGVASRFPNVNATVNATDEELNFVDGVTSNIQSQFSGKLSTSGGTVSGNVTVTGTVTAAIGSLTSRLELNDGYINKVGGISHRVQKITVSSSTTTIDPQDGNIIYILVPDTAPDTVITFNTDNFPTRSGSEMDAFFYVIIIEADGTGQVEVNLDSDLFRMTVDYHTRHPTLPVAWEATVSESYGYVHHAYLTGYILQDNTGAGDTFGDVLTYHYWSSNL